MKVLCISIFLLLIGPSPLKKAVDLKLVKLKPFQKTIVFAVSTSDCSACFVSIKNLIGKLKSKSNAGNVVFILPKMRRLEVDAFFKERLELDPSQEQIIINTQLREEFRMQGGVSDQSAFVSIYDKNKNHYSTCSFNNKDIEAVTLKQWSKI